LSFPIPSLRVCNKYKNIEQRPRLNKRKGNYVQKGHGNYVDVVQKQEVKICDESDMPEMKFD